MNINDLLQQYKHLDNEHSEILNRKQYINDMIREFIKINIDDIIYDKKIFFDHMDIHSDGASVELCGKISSEFYHIFNEIEITINKDDIDIYFGLFDLDWNDNDIDSSLIIKVKDFNTDFLKNITIDWGEIWNKICNRFEGINKFVNG